MRVEFDERMGTWGGKLSNSQESVVICGTESQQERGGGGGGVARGDGASSL